MPERSQRAWQRERTREALRAAAVELFERHGYDAVTIGQIAAAAGVTTRTFFRYFPTKDDMLFEASASTDPEVVAAILAAPVALGPVEAVSHAMRQVMGDLPISPDVLGRGLRIALSTPSLRGRFAEVLLASERLLVDTLETRTGRREEAELAAAAIMAVEQRVLARWVLHGDGDLVAMLEEALGALARGFHPLLRG